MRIEPHLVHFHGDRIIIPSFFHSILREQPLTANKPKGYMYAATNLGMFVTGSQGSIGFILSSTKFEYRANPTYTSLPNAINTFITAANLPNDTLIEPHAIFLDGISVNWFSCYASTLKMLSLQNCITNANVEDLCEYIRQMPKLSELDIRYWIYD